MSDTRDVARAADLAALGHRARLRRTDVEWLVLGARDDDPRVRTAALGALVRAGPGSRARRAWRDAAVDPEAGVRRRAAELAPAGKVGAPVRTLRRLLADADPLVAETAAWALGEMGARAVRAGAVPALADVARDHEQPLVREAAVAALGALGDPRGLPAILDACRDRPAVRRRAVLALAPFGGAEVDDALRRALGDRDWQVRQAAADLLDAPPGPPSA